MLPAHRTQRAVVGGFIAMQAILAPRIDDTQLCVATAAVALLSALVGALGQQPRQPFVAAIVTLGASLVAGVACAPVTYTALYFLTDYRAMGSGFFDELLPVAVFGGGIGLVWGGVFGIVFAKIIGASAWAWRDRAQTRLTASLAVAGGMWALSGVCFVWARSEGPVWHTISAAEWLSLVGTTVAVIATANLVIVDLWIGLVRRGAVPGYRVAAADGTASPPPLLPWGRTDGVLLRVVRPTEGPFRDAEMVEPRALVPIST